jgi:hypothetical protein
MDGLEPLWVSDIDVEYCLQVCTVISGVIWKKKRILSHKGKMLSVFVRNDLNS